MKRALLIVAAVFAAVMLVSGCSGQRKHDTPQQTKVASLTEADMNRLSLALSSSDSTTQATVLLPDLAALATGRKLLPSGSTLALLPASKVCKDNSCMVDAVVTQADGAKVTYVLYLGYWGGQWLVAGTDKKD